MFSCGNGSEVSSHDDVFNAETVDKILSEVAKLKLKCKSLRTLLLETETKRQEEKDFYDHTIIDMKSDFESSIANIKSQYYIELHQTRESKTREIEELSSLYTTAQREIAMQGAMIMSLNQDLHARDHHFRLPSEIEAEAAAEDEKRRKTNRRITALTESLQELTNKLEAAERERDTLKDELHRSREENAHLQGRLQVHQQHLHMEHRDTGHFLSGASGASSPVLNRSGRKSPPFGTPHYSINTSISTHTNSKPDYSEAAAEYERQLQVAHDEVAELKARIGELVRTKEAVEQSVRSVLSDNETLSHALEQLTRRNQATVPP